MSSGFLSSDPITRERCYLSIYFPEWSIDVTRRALNARKPDIKPAAILLTSNVMNQQVVARACKTARSHGVRPMMSTALAQALISEPIHLEPFSPLRDTNALKTLAAWCFKFSPIVGLDGELSRLLIRNSPKYSAKELNEQLASLDIRHYGIDIDLTGTEKLHQKTYRDLTAFSESLTALFRGAARIAIAPSLGGAWALSRYAAKTPLVAHCFKELLEYTANLPIEALRIDHLTYKKLVDVGIVTIGDLAHLPRYSLGHRFGAQLLCRLSQLFGDVSEQVLRITPKSTYRVSAKFEPPLSNRRSILSAIEQLFSKLISKVLRDHLAIKIFLLSIYDSNEVVNHRELSLASASKNPLHLNAIITPVIESLIFSGEVTAVTLEAKDTSRLSPSQESFHDGLNSQQSFSLDPTGVYRGYNDLMNSYSVRLGRDRIFKAQLSPSYIPEFSFRYTAEITHPGLSTKELVCEPTPDSYQATPYFSPLDRPPVLLSPPEPIISIAMLPDRPPAWIKWRGTKLNITYGIGPERIAPEWWRSGSERLPFSERDYFTVEDDSGRWLWVFRCLSSQNWFVHGVWR